MAERERLPGELNRLRRDRLPRWINEVPVGARILDLGCGQGHLLAALHKIGYTNLYGVDLSEQMLASARRLLPDSVSLVCADVRDFVFSTRPETFEVIFFHDVLEHLPREDVLEVLRALYRMLKLEGRLSVRVPNMSCIIAGYCTSIDFTHISHFTEWSLKQLLEVSGFSIGKIKLISQAPRLFWSWKAPHSMVFRMLNRTRWHLNNLLHKGTYIITDMRPRPSVFDPNLVVVATK